MGIYEELQARGLLAQVTNEEEIREMVNAGKAKFYIGFDCTADSLTAGHFMALTLMKRLQMAGNQPVALIGGGTTMIGDPSGKSDMRKMLTPETIQHNIDCFKKQMERFIDFSDGKALMVNNADWLMNLNYVEVLRDVGPHFSVNRMLSHECYKQRMERGLTFLEFNYMIMQSYDFYMLYQKYGCNMQFGGDDQWSNMLGGTELIRRKLGKDAYAMTITLLTDSQGKKMGKTAGNAVWLDPNKTSPFEFYQYWRNVGDADVMKCIRMLTFLPLEQINAMADWKDAQLNTAKEILAYELTKLVHGEEEANKAQAAAKALFVGGGDDANMPTTEITADQLTDGQIGILNLMVACKLASSNKEARTLVTQGGEHPNALHHVGIIHIAPVLVELVGAGLVGIQPNGTLGGLAHLFALGIEQQGNGHGVSIFAKLPANQFGAAQHVAPLVIASELHIAAVVLEQVVEIVGLHGHVVELQEAQALLHPLLEALCPEHVVHGEASADVPDEIDVVQVQQPVGIVDHHGLALAV